MTESQIKETTDAMMSSGGGDIPTQHKHNTRGKKLRNT